MGAYVEGMDLLELIEEADPDEGLLEVIEEWLEDGLEDAPSLH